jgi:asparagine synthase (glutamine-hydrolysing)
MRFLVVPQPDTIFDDIHKLEPGRTLVVRSDGTLHENVYWRAAAAGMGTNTADESALVAELDAKLRESVGYHMVADVPVSAFLSGGLDSSSIVALMRRHAPDQAIDTFSIAFPDRAEFDESPFARKVAQLKSVGYHVDTINENFLDDFDSIMWHLDEPFAISSAFATFYLARNAARHTKVVLTGDGGDELFAGYDGYLNDAYLGSGISGLLSLAFQAVFTFARVSRSSNSALLRLLQALRRRSGSEGLRYSERVAQNSIHACSMAFSNEVFLRSLTDWPHNLIARYYDGLHSDDRLNKKLFTEFKTRLVDEMLMKVDRMTMAHSLEARVPLLDHEVVEFAHGVPPKLKLHRSAGGPQLKYILKKAMEPHLPLDIIYRKKQGFDIPTRDWLSGNFLDIVGERLLGGQLRDSGVIDPEGVRRLVRLHSQGAQNFSGVLMVLLALETWAEAYRSRLLSVSFG